jgi:hypothetical protein
MQLELDLGDKSCQLELPGYSSWPYMPTLYMDCSSLLELRKDNFTSSCGYADSQGASPGTYQQKQTVLSVLTNRGL